jgi:hypothetical protein
MTIIEKIRVKIVKNDFELSQHAANQSIVRRIRVQELREAIMAGEVIEEYPDDKYGPSCLIFGLTESIQDTSPRIHPWRNKKPVSDKQAPEFIRGVNASIL